jgi:hypothetical protein
MVLDYQFNKIKTVNQIKKEALLWSKGIEANYVSKKRVKIGQK